MRSTSGEIGRRLIDASTATYPFAESYVALPHVRLIRGFVDRGDVGRVEVAAHAVVETARPTAVVMVVGQRRASPRPTTRTAAHAMMSLGEIEAAVEADSDVAFAALSR
ncbi:MAG: hypothetical protein ACRDSL_15545 [Pseudonocardiaceae bacterium]